MNSRIRSCETHTHNLRIPNCTLYLILKTWLISYLPTCILLVWCGLYMKSLMIPTLNTNIAICFKNNEFHHNISHWPSLLNSVELFITFFCQLQSVSLKTTLKVKTSMRTNENPRNFCNCSPSSCLHFALGSLCAGSLFKNKRLVLNLML